MALQMRDHVEFCHTLQAGVTLLQSNVYERLHENSGQAGSAPLAG